MTPPNYHHGSLRQALLTAAVEAIDESCVAEFSLRDLARRTGVSHAAPAHHFGDKAGLLTALATEGFDLLAVALEGSGDDLIDGGVGYVKFAVEHPAHFEVMFQPRLYCADNPSLIEARERANAALQRQIDNEPRDPNAALAAWSIVHGFATLWLSGAIAHEADADVGAVARKTIRILFES